MTTLIRNRPTVADNARLSKTRRKRPIPEGWATTEDLGSLSSVVESKAIFPGAESLAIDTSADAILLGGESSAGIYSISQNQLNQELEAHGPVTDTILAGSSAIIGTKHGTVTVFESGKPRVRFSAHTGEVTALTLHPSGVILASVGSDKSYAFYDLSTDRKVLQITTDSGETSLQC